MPLQLLLTDAREINDRDYTVMGAYNQIRMSCFMPWDDYYISLQLN